MKKPLSFYLGNILMLAGIALLAFIYFPVARIYLFPPSEDASIKETAYYIQIPKIHALSKVIPNVDPSNETEYLTKLKLGVAQAKATAMPGKVGTTFLFAHSTDVPWHITQYNAVFFRLGQLQQGDVITLHYNGKDFTYHVIGSKTVSPTDVQYLRQNPAYQLVLQTCTPPGTSFNRLLVFARLQKE